MSWIALEPADCDTILIGLGAVPVCVTNVSPLVLPAPQTICCNVLALLIFTGVLSPMTLLVSRLPALAGVLISWGFITVNLFVSTFVGSRVIPEAFGMVVGLGAAGRMVTVGVAARSVVPIVGRIVWPAVEITGVALLTMVAAGRIDPACGDEEIILIGWFPIVLRGIPVTWPPALMIFIGWPVAWDMTLIWPALSLAMVSVVWRTFSWPPWVDSIWILWGVLGVPDWIRRMPFWTAVGVAVTVTALPLPDAGEESTWPSFTDALSPFAPGPVG